MANTAVDDVKEEVIDNATTGLELDEDVGDDEPGGLVRPYDPTLIRVDPKMFSLRNILDMIHEGDLDLAPDFQRLKVWKSWQKSRLIESILLRIPLPAFYFSSDQSGRLQVVDGVQRLTTVYDYVRGGSTGNDHFPLTDLEYLDDELGGKNFVDLAKSHWAKRINSTQIVANVIDAQTPTAVKFDIFKRINTGGTPLEAQEIRHCMSGPQSRHLLKTLAESDEFNTATGGRISGHLRMADRELVLRVLAYWILKPLDANSTEGGSLESLLNNATAAIDRLTDSQIAELERDFRRVMALAFELFGKRAFRKWPADTEKLFPINKSLFEVWSVLLRQYSPNIIESHRDQVIANFRERFVRDPYFVASVSIATSDPTKVAYRFKVIEEILDATTRS